MYHQFVSIPFLSCCSFCYGQFLNETLLCLTVRNNYLSFLFTSFGRASSLSFSKSLARACSLIDSCSWNCASVYLCHSYSNLCFAERSLTFTIFSMHRLSSFEAICWCCLDDGLNYFGFFHPLLKLNAQSPRTLSVTGLNSSRSQVHGSIVDWNLH